MYVRDPSSLSSVPAPNFAGIIGFIAFQPAITDYNQKPGYSAGLFVGV